MVSKDNLAFLIVDALFARTRIFAATSVAELGFALFARHVHARLSSLYGSAAARTPSNLTIFLHFCPHFFFLLFDLILFPFGCFPLVVFANVNCVWILFKFHIAVETPPNPAQATTKEAVTLEIVLSFAVQSAAVLQFWVKVNFLKFRLHIGNEFLYVSLGHKYRFILVFRALETLKFPISFCEFFLDVISDTDCVHYMSTSQSLITVIENRVF